MKKAITFVDRKTGELFEETVMGDGALRFAYETFLGHCLRGLLFNTSGLSRLMGWYYDSALSKKSISSLASIPGCDPREADLPGRLFLQTAAGKMVTVIIHRGKADHRRRQRGRFQIFAAQVVQAPFRPLDGNGALWSQIFKYGDPAVGG